MHVLRCVKRTEVGNVDGVENYCVMVKERRNYESFIARIGVRAPVFYLIVVSEYIKKLKCRNCHSNVPCAMALKMKNSFFVVF